MKKILISLCIAAFLFTGCAAQNKVEPQNPINSEELARSLAELAQIMDQEIVLIYPVNNVLDVEITFENQRTYDGIQMGLDLLQKIKTGETIPDIEDQAFYPKYFAMINTDISDGLLFISEEESAEFVCRIYFKYQRTIDSEYLDVQKKRVIKEIIDR